MPRALFDETIIKVLLERGVNYIDTAESYNRVHNEMLIGKAIKEFDRKSLFITTKLALRHHRRMRR